MPSSPGDMRRAILANLPKKTGRTLEEWVAIVRAHPGGGHKERVDWLKKEFGLGGSTAGLIVWEADGEGGDVYADTEALVAAQYAGDKAALRPILDAVLALVPRIGDDVRVGYRKTYVSLSRARQFAVIVPTTRSRVDLGLALGDAPARGRLLEAKNLGGGDRNTRRVALASPADVDAEVLRLLQRAAEAGG
jgi:hypothetical protein